MEISTSAPMSSDKNDGSFETIILSDCVMNFCVMNVSKFLHLIPMVSIVSNVSVTFVCGHCVLNVSECLHLVLVLSIRLSAPLYCNM